MLKQLFHFYMTYIDDALYASFQLLAFVCELTSGGLCRLMAAMFPPEE